MKEEHQKYLQYIPGVRFWIILVGIIIFLAALKEANTIVNMLLLAMLLTAISLPPLNWMIKKGVNSTVATLTIILSILVLMGLTGLVIGASANNFVEKLPYYQLQFEKVWLDLSETLVDFGLVEDGYNPLVDISPDKILPVAGTFFAGFANAMGESLIVFIFFIFMIFEAKTFSKKVKYISNNRTEQAHLTLIRLRKYFAIKTITSLATGISITIALLLLGVDFPVLWGFLAFVLNFIPSIGSFIAGIPAVLLAFVQLGPWGALITAVVYFVLNTIIGNVIEPQLMGRNLGISPLIVFISMIFFGYILGPIGMLIATPLTIVLKIILDSQPITRNLGIMLGDGSDIKEEEI